MKSKVIGKFRVESFENENGDFLARLIELRPKAKYSSRREKNAWFYKFPSEESRDEKYNKAVLGLEEQEAKKERVREQKKNFTNPFSMGDIFYDSWGYDQTNIDFYQVVKVNSKSVVLRSLEADLEHSKHGHDYGYVTPKKDKFYGSEEILKRVMIASWEEENSPKRFYLKSTFGWMSKWDGEKKTASWGR